MVRNQRKQQNQKRKSKCGCFKRLNIIQILRLIQQVTLKIVVDFEDEGNNFMAHQECIDHLQMALEMIPPGKQNDELRMHVSEALKEVKSGYGQEDSESESEMPHEGDPYMSENRMPMSMMKRRSMTMKE